MRLGCHTITWGGVVGHPVGVTSVKDLYYLANGSMDQAIHDIGATGYEGVELFDGNLVAAPDELPKLLAAKGLELVSVYTGANFVYADILADEFARIRGVAELAAAAGARQLVVGGGARRASGTSDDDYDRLAASLERVVELAETYGLVASYHPHLGTIVESPPEIERLLSRTRIGFCPDTAHLVAGGGDPVRLIKQYGERITHVHLKDVRRDPVTFLPLGQGDVDFPAVLAALDEEGYDGWLLVELDSYDGDPREAAQLSKDFLDGMLS